MKTDFPQDLLDILKNLCVDPAEVRSVYTPGNANTPWVLRMKSTEQPWAVAGRAFQTFTTLDAALTYLGERQGVADDVYELVPLFDDRSERGVAPIQFVGKIGQIAFCTAPETFIARAGAKEEIEKQMAICLNQAGTGDTFGTILPEGVKLFRLKKVVS
jgi:hypothetical protein